MKLLSVSDEVYVPFGSYTKTVLYPKIQEASLFDLFYCFKDTIYLGINYMTLKLDNDLAIKTCKISKDNYGLPVTDLIRFEDKEIIDNIEDAIDQWK